MPLPQYAVFWQFLRGVLPVSEESIIERIVGFVYELPAEPLVVPGNPSYTPVYFFGQYMQEAGPPGMPPFRVPPPSLRQLC